MLILLKNALFASAYYKAACLCQTVTVFTLDEPVAVKSGLLVGTFLSRHRSRGTLSPRGSKFCHKKLESL